MGRDYAGIHHRSATPRKASGSGEEVAIAMLPDLVRPYTEDFRGFQLTRLDGTPVTICKGCTN